MKIVTPPVPDQLAALADPIRGRLLLLLDGRELRVSELCRVTQLPQSTVSRHLKILVDAGWAASRAEGTSNVYTMPRDAREGMTRRLWLLVRDQLVPTATAAQDHRRLQAALAARRTTSQAFFHSSAGQWDRLRDELFGDRFHLAALAALAAPGGTYGDLGCGTGQTSAALAPFVSRVIAVDSSTAMLHAARQRLRACANVDVRRGDLEALPIDDGELDAALLMLVLHHVVEPALALADVARALRPGGRVVVVDMQPHDRETYRQQMGHVWLGFTDTQLHALLTASGFTEVRVVPLPPDVDARGPALWVATGDRTH